MPTKHREYWKDGLLHRDDGPALITQRLGLSYEEHWRDGQLHREVGPAVWHDRVREEYFNRNSRHRLDGPAIDAPRRIRLPLMDRAFDAVPRLATDLRPWTDFSTVGQQRIPNYLDMVFGGTHPFATYGDFGAMPTVMVERVRFTDLDLSQLRYAISYDLPDWRHRFPSDDNELPGVPAQYKPVGKNPSYDPCEDCRGIFDLLGTYSPKDKLITLYIRAISECAERLDAIPNNPCGPSPMTLTTLIFLHELGHAIHHAVRGGGADDDLGGALLAETVAQHFMMTCVRTHGVRAEWLEGRLEEGQPKVYRAWRDTDPTTWEGFRALVTRQSARVETMKEKMQMSAKPRIYLKSQAAYISIKADCAGRKNLGSIEKPNTSTGDTFLNAKPDLPNYQNSNFPQPANGPPRPGTMQSGAGSGYEGFTPFNAFGEVLWRLAEYFEIFFCDEGTHREVLLLGDGYSHRAINGLDSSIYTRGDTMRGDRVVIVRPSAFDNQQKTPQELDDYFKRLKDMLQAKLPVSRIYFPRGDRYPIPPWFEEWCKDHGIEIKYYNPEHCRERIGSG